MVEYKLNEAGLSPAHRHLKVLGRRHESISEMQFQHAVEPGVDGDADGSASRVAMVAFGWLASFEPCFGFVQTTLAQ
jgi:hypothetical protein